MSEVELLQRRNAARNCGAALRRRNAAQNYGAESWCRIAVQNSVELWCKIAKTNEFQFARYFKIYIKAGNPRTEKFIVLGILNQKTDRVHYFAL